MRVLCVDKKFRNFTEHGPVKGVGERKKMVCDKCGTKLIYNEVHKRAQAKEHTCPNNTHEWNRR